jgi:predicted NUDIX family NTP pyrophosphohydrolase
MTKRSAGLLMYRLSRGPLEVFLVHPGGPYWVRKDKGAWTLPKGELAEGEDPLTAARREFHEETGFAVTEPLFALGEIRQRSGKVVSAWAFEGDADPAALRSNTYELEWPPRSGQRVTAPEIDRGDWFSMEKAREYLLPAQLPLLDALQKLLGGAK